MSKRVIEPSLIGHLKLYQYFSLHPLGISSTSCSDISKLHIALSTLLTIMFSIHQWSPEFHLRTIGPFTESLAILDQTIFCIYCPVAVYFMVRARDKYGASLKALMALQRTVGIDRYNLFPTSKFMLFVVTITTIPPTAVRVLKIFNKQMTPYHLLNDLFWFMSSSYVFTWIYTFTYLITCISKCLTKLSQIKLENQENLNNFIHIYNRLTDVAADINGIYDPVISLMLLSSLVNIISSTSSALFERRIGYLAKLSYYIGFSVPVVVIVHLLNACQSATDKFVQSNNKLFNYLIRNKIIPFEDHLLSLYHLCARRDFTFKVCKSLNINYTLGLSLVAAYFTYIIVFFQIDQPLMKDPSRTNPLDPAEEL